jgi:hypothetical protein
MRFALAACSLQHKEISGGHGAKIIAVLQPITPEVAMRSIWHQQLRTRGGHDNVFQLGGRHCGAFYTVRLAGDSGRRMIYALDRVCRTRHKAIARIREVAQC